jgi:DNA-binding transcriptional ArsR family regulator
MPAAATAASAEIQVLKGQFFKALAHPIRIRLLEALVAGDARVQDLQRVLDLDQPIVSQQLARLRASGIVVIRRDGANTLYGVADPMLGDLLQVAKRILNRRLVGVQSLLKELEGERSSNASPRTRSTRPRRAS